jgi:hypothetical protein
MDAHEAWRHQGDPLADHAVRALRARGGRGDPWSRARAAVRDGDPAVRALFDAVEEVPAWVDFQRMEAGRKAFLRNAPLTILVLVAGSLVESFCAAKGAKVLAATGRLEREPLKRVYETASFVRDVLVEGGVRPGGAGHHAAVRVRLLHAYARHYVATRGDHDAVTDGVPINQEDMVHTLTLFSHVVIRGVEQLGGRLSRDERESYAHMWRWLGFVLGIEASLLPRSYDDERALYRRIIARQYRPSDDSRRLCFAVLDAVAGQPPFFLPRPGLYAVSRRIVGDTVADALELPRTYAWTAALAGARGATRAASRVARAAPLSDRALAKIGHAFVEANRARVFSSMPLPNYEFRTCA